MTIRNALLIWVFCSAAYSGEQVGNFAPREVGNIWVYEGIYTYQGPYGSGMTTYISTMEVISNRKIADTEYVIIEIQDTGPSDTSYRYVFIDTCKFFAGILINPDEYWTPLPFFHNSTIDRDSLSEFRNGYSGLYYVYDSTNTTYVSSDTRYIKDIGLCTRRWGEKTGMSSGTSNSVDLISFNGQPYDPGEVIKFEFNTVEIHENDTILWGLTGALDFRFSTYDKIGNRPRYIQADWVTTGSLNNSYTNYWGQSYFRFETKDSSYQEGYIIATPADSVVLSTVRSKADSGLVLSPDRVYVIIDPTSIITSPRQKIHQSDIHRIRNRSVYNLRGQKLPFFNRSEKTIPPGFRIICDNKGAKKQLFVLQQ